MMKENYSEVREVANNRVYRKRVGNAFVLGKVEEMKLQSSSTVGTEKIDVVRALWLDVIHRLDHGYFV